MHVWVGESGYEFALKCVKRVSFLHVAVFCLAHQPFCRPAAYNNLFLVAASAFCLHCMKQISVLHVQYLFLRCRTRILNFCSGIGATPSMSGPLLPNGKNATMFGLDISDFAHKKFIRKSFLQSSTLRCFGL